MDKKDSVILTKIKKALKEFSQGHYDAELKFPTTANKELQQMVDHLFEIATMIHDISSKANIIASGNFTEQFEEKGKSDELAKSINHMVVNLLKANETPSRDDWLVTGQRLLNEKMFGVMDKATLCQGIITCLAKHLNAQIGALYTMNEEEILTLAGSHAYTKQENVINEFKLGEGLVGQAAMDKEIISVSDIPDDYIRIYSSAGYAFPRNVVVIPFVLNEKVTGVIELGSFKTFSDNALKFLSSVMESIAHAVNSVEVQEKLKDLLEETQRQSEELLSQKDELQTSNEALKQQANKLEASQQQLAAINEELEEKSESVTQQKSNIEEKNKELDIFSKDMEIKAQELEVASRYKSDFLANMSHELRTPLNSLMLLSRSLKENDKGNLTDSQIESASIIYNSGNDLLQLINEILDLSKIEAGQMEADCQEVSIQELMEEIDTSFRRMTNEKGLTLEMKVDENVPDYLFSDRKKLNQILKNLLSNAIKFTTVGAISTEVTFPSPEVNLSKSGLSTDNSIAISVQDTGIGIAEDTQETVFQAFKQAESGTARKYGGTGLGLSICTELARLLGGEIQLQSEYGKGSTFTLYLPIKWKGKDVGMISSDDSIVKPQRIVKPKPSLEFADVTFPDDRDNLKEDIQTLLIVDDDTNFATILMRLGHERGFQCLVATSGENGIELARQFIPHAVILDIKLPEMNGLEVLRNLKEDVSARHIPVHIMSVLEETTEARHRGAIGYITKPVSKEKLEEAFEKFDSITDRKVKELLIVNNDSKELQSLISLLKGKDVKITEAKTAEATFEALEEKDYDCIVMDLTLPDMPGFDLLKKLERDEGHNLPPILITLINKELSREEELELHSLAQSMVVKGVKSKERLLDETSLFLHRAVCEMPDKNKKTITKLHDADGMFQGKKILIVDDDMRNVFALSNLLEEKGMVVLKAEDGKQGFAQLEKEPKIDLILMDIMMPVMDGHEATRKIRELKKFAQLPIIALTAKAMIEDREKCIEAGASDYMAKPVDAERLLSLMRGWLYQ